MSFFGYFVPPPAPVPGSLVSVLPPPNSVWHRNEPSDLVYPRPRVLNASGNHMLGWSIQAERDGIRVLFSLYQEIGERYAPSRTLSLPVFPTFTMLRTQFGVLGGKYQPDERLTPIFENLGIPYPDVAEYNEAYHDMEFFFRETMGRWFKLDDRHTKFMDTLYFGINRDVMTYLQHPTSSRQSQPRPQRNQG